MRSSKDSKGSSAQSVVTKEISKGIFLHKQQHVKEDAENPEIVYIFKVEVKTLQVLEFTADFTDSENLMLENHNDLIATTTVQPFTSEIVAVLRLFKNWKLKSKFRFTMHSPPIEDQKKYLAKYYAEMKSIIGMATEKIWKVPSEVISTSELEIQMKRHDMRFVDPDFLPTDPSLYGNLDSPFDTLIQWRRPEEFISIENGTSEGTSGAGPLTIYNPVIEVNDIKEGALGDGWFISAIATLAEVPPLIDRLFLTKEVSKEGVYRVKICKNGEWTAVTVDDYFPCIPDSGPIFARSSPNELWLMLLEKAYAKVHGSYLALKGGFAHEALIDLTGCPCTYYNFGDEFVKDMIKNGSLWAKLKEAEEKGYLLSASTSGEQRWADTPTGDTEDNSLLAGHSYTITTLTEIKGQKLLKIKNIWGQFEWTGDWSVNSPLWTPEIKKELGLNMEEDEGNTFWMSFSDFLSNFKALNICCVKNWQELRIKGKFIRVQDMDNPNIEVVFSKWYYNVEITEKTQLVIAVHQEDERIDGTLARRPYLDVGIAILKKTGDSIDLVELRDLVNERECEMDVILDPGTYIILPRTTGCTLRKPLDTKPEEVKLLNKNGEINERLESTLRDIFRKFDMLLNRELTYTEFKGICECINRKLTEEEFKSEFLNKFCSTSKGLTYRGFRDFFIKSIKELDEPIVWDWLENLGYDRELYPIRSRTFILSFHSDTELAVTVKDAVPTDLDNKTNALIVERFGQEAENKRGVKVLYAFSQYFLYEIYIYIRQVHAYSYGILNEYTKPIEATLDCSSSKYMIFSTKSPIIKKVFFTVYTFI